MKVTITNKLLNPLSTSFGLIAGQGSISLDMSPQEMYLSAADMKTLEDAGKISVIVENEAAKADKLEMAQVGGMFISAEQTGNGSAQNVAHGLGVIPGKVMVALTGGPGAYTQPTITEGTHTSTNAVVTVTSSWKYRVIAFK